MNHGLQKLITVLFVLLIVAQCVLIANLANKIKSTKTNILGVSVNVINSTTITTRYIDGMKNFYEPKAGTCLQVPIEWSSRMPVNSINRDSLNERFDYKTEKNPGTFRIITLGDSYTYGQNVSTKDNWTELLEDYLNARATCPGINKYEVINLGVGGYDTAYEVERYKLRGQKYNPDLVIWYVTDLSRITETVIELAKKLNIDDNLYRKTGRYYESWDEARNLVIRQYGEWDLVNYQLILMETLRNEYYRDKPLLFVSPFNNMKAHGFRNAFYGGTHVYQDKRNLLPDLHFNEKGHQKFMEETVKSLQNNKLLPCRVN